MNFAVIGSGSVGKSSLVARLVAECPPISSLSSSSSSPPFCWAASFFCARVGSSDQLEKEDVCVCDVSQRMLVSFFAHQCEGLLVVYDVTSQRSFEEAQRLVLLESSRRALVLVANKADVAAVDRVVAAESGRFFCSSREVPFVETSALSGANVQLAFALLAKSVKQRAALVQPVPQPDLAAGFTMIGGGGGRAATAAPVIPPPAAAGAVVAVAAVSPVSPAGLPSFWARDEDVKYCKSCNSKVFCVSLFSQIYFVFHFFFFQFSAVLRKHHCRKCGQVCFHCILIIYLFIFWFS